MRVAFVSTVLCYPWGGADTLWTHAAEAAIQRGDNVLLALSSLTSAHARVQALLRQGAHWHTRIPSSGPTSTGRRMLRKFHSWFGDRDPLTRALKRFAPDLVVFSGGGTYDLILESDAWQWLKAEHVPFRFIANWQSERPTLNPVELANAASALTAAESIFFVSHRNLAATRRQIGAPLPNAAVIQNPLRIDPTTFTSPAWPEPSTWRFATVGRLEPVKGIDLLAAAAARVLGVNRDWRLNVYGDGAQKDELPHAFANHGVADRATLRGYEPMLSAIWSENHLLISPALDEGVPMTIPEAMLCERPVLATDVGGAADWITPGETGFICPTPTLEALSATLDDAWSQRHAWRDLGARARPAAAARYKPLDYLRLIAPPKDQSC